MKKNKEEEEGVEGVVLDWACPECGRFGVRFVENKIKCVFCNVSIGRVGGVWK
jgi:uncharacterized membrane protein